MSDDTYAPLPATGPWPDPQVSSAPPGFLIYAFYGWNPDTQKWSTGQLLTAAPWNNWAHGYYYLKLEAPTFPELIVVHARTRPDGSTAPNVLIQPPQGPESPDCPTGMQDADDDSSACILTVSQSVPTCPAGTHFDPATEQCVPDQVTTIPPPQCPQGMVWDPVNLKCIVPTTQTPTCPPGQVWDPNTQTCIPAVEPIQPCTPIPGQYTDELVDGLDCVSQNLLYIQQQLSNLTSSSGQGPQNLDPVTCKQLTGLVIALNITLTAIAKELGKIASSEETTVDLTAIVAALQQLAAAAASYPPIWNAIAAALGTQLGNIATAISSQTGTDLTPVVDQLKILVSEGDVAQATFDALSSQGFITGADLQVLHGLGWADSFFYLLRTLIYRAVTNFMAAFGISIGPGGITIANPSDTIANDLGAIFQTILGTSETALSPTVKGLVAAIRAVLTPPGPTTLGVINVDPDKPVTLALGAAFAAGAAAWLLAYAGVDEGEPLAHVAELIAGAVGFEELGDIQIGPLIRNGIALAADRQARALFQQELPGTSALQRLVAMGLLDPARAKALSLFNGTSDELYPIQLLGSYRGFNARQMLRLIETGLFSNAEIADELTFSAMRAVSQSRMLRAAPFLATASQRSSLVAAIEAAAVAGLIADADVTAEVDAAQNNDDRDSLILARVHLQQLVAEAKDLETEYTTLFIGGIIDDPTFRNDLAGIGLQPWKVNTVAAKAEARANSTLRRKNLAEAAAITKATDLAERTAARKSFMTGTIDAAALLTALLATGLTAAQAAAQVETAALQKGGALRWLYGLQLSPQAATLLRERVTALTDQRKRLQITDTAFVQALQTLGIQPPYLNALQAAADAMITPKTAAVVIPVQTS